MESSVSSSPRRRVRRLLPMVGVLGALFVLIGVAVNLSVSSRLDRVDGVFDGLATRPAAAPGETILMIGTRPGGTVDVPWLPDEQSVESVMLVEIGADDMEVGVESLPMGDGVAASLTSSAPSAAVDAVESWAGRRIDHLVVVDWRTFAHLAVDNGVDPDYTYGSPARVQHDYLRAVMEATLHTELRRQPLNLYRALSITADGAAIDDGWSLLELDRLVLSLRNLRSHHIEFSMAQAR